MRVAVINFSGNVGKSTLARMVTMIERPTAGHLMIEGTDVVAAGKQELHNPARRAVPARARSLFSMSSNRVRLVCNAGAKPNNSPVTIDTTVVKMRTRASGDTSK